MGVSGSLVSIPKRMKNISAALSKLELTAVSTTIHTNMLTHTHKLIYRAQDINTNDYFPLVSLNGT